MQLVEFVNGNFVFNWDQIPDESVKLNIVLRNKIFEELKKQYSDITIVDPKILFEINKYVISRLKDELRYVLQNKTINKNT